jgi:hypothetical protein
MKRKPAASTRTAAPLSAPPTTVPTKDECEVLGAAVTWFGFVALAEGAELRSEVTGFGEIAIVEEGIREIIVTGGWT